jgi:hypothetical protein
MSKSKVDTKKYIEQLNDAIRELRGPYLQHKSMILNLEGEIKERLEKARSLGLEMRAAPERQKASKKSQIVRVLTEVKGLKLRLAPLITMKNKMNQTLKMYIGQLKTLKLHSQHAASAVADAADLELDDDDDDDAIVVSSEDDDEDEPDSGVGVSGAAAYGQRTKLGCSDCRNGNQCARCKADERAARRAARSAASLEDFGAGVVFSRHAPHRSSPRRSAVVEVEDSDTGVVFSRHAPRRSSPRRSAVVEVEDSGAGVVFSRQAPPIPPKTGPAAVAAAAAAAAAAAQPSKQRNSPSPKKGCWPWSRKKSNSSERSKSPSWWKKCFSRKNKDGNPPPTGGRKSKTAKRQKKSRHVM